MLHGGINVSPRYLARGGKITTISGTWCPERVILLEFDNTEQVHNWLTSSEYAEVASLREFYYNQCYSH